MKASRLVSVLLLLIAARIHAAEPQRIKLWQGNAPAEPATKPENTPLLFAYFPEAEIRTPTAVVICPGGGYGHLAMEKEGQTVAEFFNSLGVTAFVLQYRNNSSGHKHPVPMLDGQRAIRLIRARADEWKIDPAKIGVMGFSAGGHLASTLATHFDDGISKAEDKIERVSSRPDFLILCYPVITMTESHMHRGSRKNLLGENPDADLARSLSNETQVTDHTPPAFIFHTDADTAVPAENCVSFYLALRRAGVPAEMHIYQDGPHGVGIARGIPGTSTWPDRLHDWMRISGLLGSGAEQKAN